MIFLSADAFGVLPPVSILTPEQTKYYFLSGFTAKLAGTERGITEPTPTFSACFGQAFLELHPTKYAEELVKKMEKSGAKAYLVNTGWNGTGKRISIPDTRGIIDAILDGAILKAPTKKIPYFDFEVPTELPNVNPAILDPRDTYAEASVWEEKAKDLAARFIKNFGNIPPTRLVRLWLLQDQNSKKELKTNNNVNFPHKVFPCGGFLAYDNDISISISISGSFVTW